MLTCFILWEYFENNKERDDTKNTKMGQDFGFFRRAVCECLCQAGKWLHENRPTPFLPDAGDQAQEDGILLLID